MEVAALGEFEVKFLTSIGRLMTESEQWVHLPLYVTTVRYRSLTFCLLARVGSTVHALLQLPREEFFPLGFSQCSLILPSRQACPSR